jgi:hypothetical protein
MSKKVFCLALGAMLLALSFPAAAQQPAKVHFIGFLETGTISLRAHLWETLRQRLVLEELDNFWGNVREPPQLFGILAAGYGDQHAQ